jgi:uncharacterized protein YbaP (TraB family)
MKKWSTGIVATLLTCVAFAQDKPGNTLLWKVTGPGMENPSYLYGTIHMICKEDAVISPNLDRAILECDRIYFEVDMDNMLEMVVAVRKMRMLGDTTLRDLLDEKDYEKVKDFFTRHGSMLPFSVLETYKPILATSMIEQGALPCDKTAVMEQVIMERAKEFEKEIRGLESLSYQAGILDSIPYRWQARQLLEFVEKTGDDGEGNEDMEKMFKAYKEQDLDKLEELLIETEAGMSRFTELLLYRRNANWVKKLKDLLGPKKLLIAIGAGHLPGKQGLIELLRKEGYTVTPVENDMRVRREI